VDGPLILAIGCVVAVLAIVLLLHRRASHAPDGPVAIPGPRLPEAAGEPPYTVLELYRGFPDEHELLAAPMVATSSGTVTLRDWLVHYGYHREQAWPMVVADFYRRAAQDPAIASYFSDTDMPRLQRHFLAALTMLAGQGLQVGTVARMAEAHVGVHDDHGRRITPEVYDGVVDTLVAVLAAQGVPEVTCAQLGAIADTLRHVIVPAGAAAAG
jgi:truncated hemoglobin YjbI